MKRTLTLLLLGYVCASGLWAQAGSGSGAVSGTVKEAAGDGIPEAVVELTNPALGLKRVMSTTDDGLFTAPALAPAAGYRLKMSHKNFVDWQSGEFEVSVGQTVCFQVTLKHTPEATQYDEGSIPAPKVQDLKAGTGSVVTPRQLDSLPSNRRRVETFVGLAPLAPRDWSNAFYTDGILTSNMYGRPAGAAPQLTPDSLQELQVLTGNYAPEFGASVGIVNAATRSGTETLHGAAYLYHDSPAWNAFARYGLGKAKLDRQNQFGASLGGAIRPGRIFYFANAEVWDGRGTGMNRLTTSLLAPSECKATAAQCAAAAKFLQSQTDVPVARSGRTATGLARVDYRRSDRNQFTLTGNALNGRSPNGPLDQVAPDGGLLGLPDTKEYIRYGKLGWTAAVSGNTLNELRYGLFEDRVTNPASQNGTMGLLVAGVSLGNPRPDTSVLNEHRGELVESFTASANTHTFRLGLDTWSYTDHINGMNAAGTYVYNSLTTFAQDLATGGRNYSYFTQSFGNPYRKLDGRQYNLYAMDTWRPFSRLTIVAGVRWEKARRPQPGQANPNYYKTGKIAAPVIDFAPRISVAYRTLAGTVLRFGYSWFYEPLPGRALDALYLGNGVDQTNITVNPNQNGAPAFPNVLTSSVIPSGTTNLIYGADKMRDPRLEQYTLAIERHIGNTTTLTITGVRERGKMLWTLVDQNLTPSTVSKTYSIVDAAGKQINTYTTPLWTARLDSRYAHVYSVENGGAYWRSALAVELRKRLSHGVSAQASYTWSHALDNTPGPALAGVFPLSLTGDGTAPRANTAADQRHRLALNWTWQPTVTHSSSAMARHLLNGWAVSGIATVASGLPLTPEVLVAGQQFSTTAMTYTTSLNGTGSWPRVPFQGIGSLYMRGQYNLDARVSRTLDFTERVKGVILFEAFNALNSQYDVALNTVAYQAIPTTPPSGAVNGPYTGVIRPVASFGTGTVANEARRAQLGFRLVF